MLHNWCFHDTNPIFSFKGLRFRVEVFTDSNRYDLDPEKSEFKDGILLSKGLTWAGGQEKAEGEVTLCITQMEGRLLFDLKAKKDEPIRRVKIAFLDLPLGTIVGRRMYEETPNEDGTIYRYPNGWDDLFTAILLLKEKNGIRYFRSLDKTVRPKTFMVRKEGEGLYLEMIHEADARFPKNEMIVPTWELGSVKTVDEAFEIQRRFVEKTYGLVPWEQRKDVPEWMRNISLVVSIHGMHWSGYIFSDYADMEKKLEILSHWIDPKKVLVYIPGFDGRYYFKYPDYSPDPRMGGKEGMHHFVDFAHKLGFHLMPMFMANGANPKTPGFEIWGAPSFYYSSNGYPRGVGSCDWDTSRGYDLGCGIGMNPGSPLWQDHLVKEINRQVEEYSYDAIFLDLAAIYVNDPHYSTHEGMIQMINRLHKAHPHLLIATEGWYDALAPYFPLSQAAGDAGRGGAMIYHDTPSASFFDTYCRCVGHLCLPDPAEHRTGVFEWGHNPTSIEMPLRKGLIPTLTIVGDTLEKAPDDCKKIIENAERYYKLFIKGKGGFTP